MDATRSRENEETSARRARTKETSSTRAERDRRRSFFLFSAVDDHQFFFSGRDAPFLSTSTSTSFLFQNTKQTASTPARSRTQPCATSSTVPWIWARTQPIKPRSSGRTSRVELKKYNFRFFFLSVFILLFFHLAALFFFSCCPPPSKLKKHFFSH